MEKREHEELQTKGQEILKVENRRNCKETVKNKRRGWKGKNSKSLKTRIMRN